MKVRNVRRRQWKRYVNRLYQLTRRLPPREASPDPFDSTDPIVLYHPAYDWRVRRDSLRWHARATHRWRRTVRWVGHDCVWEPTDLPIDAAGNTRPGFQCTYELENGQGRCGSNVFRIEDVVGQSHCIVVKGGPGW